MAANRKTLQGTHKHRQKRTTSEAHPQIRPALNHTHTRKKAKKRATNKAQRSDSSARTCSRSRCRPPGQFLFPPSLLLVVAWLYGRTLLLQTVNGATGKQVIRHNARNWCIALHSQPHSSFWRGSDPSCCFTALEELFPYVRTLRCLLTAPETRHAHDFAAQFGARAPLNIVSAPGQSA